MSEYSMPSYFQTMPVIGKEVAHFSEENAAQIQEVEQEIHEIREAALEAGKSTEALNESGQWTAMQRIEELVDEGTWCPLNSLYNPQDNDNGSVGIVKGLGRINGKWAVIIASDNKKLAGAWVPGQADALLRGSDTAKRLRIPLVYVLNCSGVKLDEQEKVYPNRPRRRHPVLSQQRAEPDGYSRHRRHLRHQPRRRRLSLHQPHHPHRA